MGARQMGAAATGMIERQSRPPAHRPGRDARALDPLEQAIVLAIREAARLTLPARGGRVGSATRHPKSLAGTEVMR
jgi:hypothetical protein